MSNSKIQGNPAIQVRLHPTTMSKVEQKAIDAGYITPAGKANLADYVRSLIMNDLNRSAITLDGNSQNEEYKVK